MKKQSVGIIVILLLLIGLGISVEHIETDAAVKEATVAGTVTDTEGKALVAQLVITGEDFSTRINTDLLGRYEIVLPLGGYRCEITKGSEYERKAVDIDVTDRKPIYMEPIQLKKLYRTDWIAGDLHQHSVYSFDAKDSPADILLSDLSVGLSFGAITDHNDIRANAEFRSATLMGFTPFTGIEITTDRGHYNAINFDRFIDPDISHGEVDIRRILGEIREDPDALAQINHPLRDEMFDFQDWDMVDQFDTFEVWNGKGMPPYVAGESNYKTLHKWFELLNAGVYLPATAGSDNHDISGNKMFMAETYASDDERYFMTNMYSGSPRTYVHAEGESPENILAAVKNGNSFLTNNPLAYLDIDGAIPGQSTGAGQKAIHVRIQSNRELTHCRIVKNGSVLHEEDLNGLTAETVFTDTLSAGDWVMLEAMGENGDYAMTNPVFIQ